MLHNPNPKISGRRTRRAGQTLLRKSLHAELVGDNRCAIADFAATSSTPILALCRILIAAGFDPTMPMECYRGDTLALRIRSIGEAAALEVNAKGTGFIARRAVRAGPFVRKTERAGP